MIQFNISDPKFNFTIIQFKINSIQKIIQFITRPKKEKREAFLEILIQVTGKFQDHLKIIQTIQKLSRLSGNFPAYPETFRIIRKYPAYLETFQAIRKCSGPPVKYPNYLKTFQAIQKTF